MSKPTRASINLGNATHARGFNDGLNGRPKTIKKSHAHAHRYHTGYILGVVERDTSMRSAMEVEMNQGLNVSTRVYQVEDTKPEDKPKGLWARFMAWFRG